jgi:hypothetical protein
VVPIGFTKAESCPSQPELLAALAVINRWLPGEML